MWEKALEIEIPTTKGLVHGLIEGNDYLFRVIAVNKAGQSEPSDTSKTFTAKPRYRKYFVINFNALTLHFSITLRFHVTSLSI